MVILQLFIQKMLLSKASCSFEQIKVKDLAQGPTGLAALQCQDLNTHQ